MKLLILFLAASGSLHFDITDGRGKKASGIVIEASDSDSDGWRQLSITKSKRPAVIVWPYDVRVKAPDGPGGIPVIVVESGVQVTDGNAIAAVRAGALLGNAHGNVAEGTLAVAGDPFEAGVALLSERKPSEAIGPLGQALRDRERQLTRIPSEIYAAAMLYGRALLDANKFDDASVAFLKALKERPSDPEAHKLRAEALVKAGKPGATAN